MKFQIIPKSCFNLKTYIDNTDNKKKDYYKRNIVVHRWRWMVKLENTRF